MNFHGTRWLAALVLVFATFGLQAAANAQSSYRLELTIARDGSLVARPVLEVEAGAEAEVRNDDPLKPDAGFKILVTATPLEFSSTGQESVKLKIDFSAQQGSKWVSRGQHVVTAVLGKPLSFGFPPTKDEPKGSKFELTVRPSNTSAEAATKR
ncbi:hypothetical protein [Dokdonella sp.]|uniref:hypothetical protein n=1 Tax=Dokdonella sp. TaxID=2291710 RepID=UPI003C33AE54